MQPRLGVLRAHWNELRYWLRSRTAAHQVLIDPQAEANGYIAEIDVPNYGKTKVVTNVVQLSDTPGLGATRPPPKLGEHTSEIMVSLGFSPDEVAEVLSPIEAAAAEIIGLVIS